MMQHADMECHYRLLREKPKPFSEAAKESTNLIHHNAALECIAQSPEIPESYISYIETSQHSEFSIQSLPQLWL